MRTGSIGALLTRGEYKVNSPEKRFPAHLTTHEQDDVRYTKNGLKIYIKKQETCMAYLASELT
jgi:hypothetical protein